MIKNKSLIVIIIILVLCDITTTIVGLNMGLVESNVITLQFLNQFGNITGLIISSILKLSLLIGTILIINKFNIIIPQTIKSICINTILIIVIITTSQAILNNILLIIVLL